jgi:PPOX class probable F420-dependent enzyme
MPSLDSTTSRFLVAAADHGVLATAGDGRPHLVPVVYAVDGDTVVTAIDHKPKSTRRLARLHNLERDPRCTLLVDHYEDDWDRLWWVRVDGTAVVDGTPATVESAARLLAERYPQYEEDPPPGPVIRMTIERVTGWAASEV